MLLAVAFLFLSEVAVFYSGTLFFGRHESAGKACAAANPQFRASPPLLPGTLANGLAWGDFDNDGWEDLFVAGYPAGGRPGSGLLLNTRGTFSEVTAAAGLPDDLASAAGIFFDYDSDGWVDLLTIDVSWSGPPQPKPSARLRAFRNEKGVFRETTGALGLDRIVSESSEGALAAADFDNDGRLDIVTSFAGWRKFYYNFNSASERFKRDPISIFGAGGTRAVCDRNDLKALWQEAPGLGAAIEADFGQDAFLHQGGCLHTVPVVPPGILVQDSAVSRFNILAAIPGELLVFANTGQAFSDTGPMPFAAESIFRGNRQATQGLPWPFISRKFFQPVAMDANRDGRPDLLVAADFGRNILLQNQGNFKFRDVSLAYGLGIFGSGMGVAVGDPERRGELDFVVTNVSNAFYFRPHGNSFKLDQNLSLNHRGFGWGVAFLDVDSDGWADLYFANGIRGWREEEGAELDANDTASLPTGIPVDEQRYPSRYLSAIKRDLNYKKDVLYRNRDGTFLDRSDLDICVTTANTRPVAVADWNNDGYEDLAVGAIDQEGKNGVLLYENRGGQNHFVKVRLEGRPSNRYGVGAVVTVIARDGSRQSQLVAIGESFASQHSLIKTFGLGAERVPVTIEVRWPSGTFQTLTEIAPDTMLTVHEAESNTR